MASRGMTTGSEPRRSVWRLNNLKPTGRRAGPRVTLCCGKSRRLKKRRRWPFDKGRPRLQPRSQDGGQERWTPASQGWRDQAGSPQASAALEAEAPRTTAPASPRGQTTVQAPTPPTVAGSTVAQARQTAPEATSRPLASEAPALVLRAHVPQGIDTSAGEPLTQPGQKQQAPPLEAL